MGRRGADVGRKRPGALRTPQPLEGLEAPELVVRVTAREGETTLLPARGAYRCRATPGLKPVLARRVQALFASSLPVYLLPYRARHVLVAVPVQEALDGNKMAAVAPSEKPDLDVRVVHLLLLNAASLDDTFGGPEDAELTELCNFPSPTRQTNPTRIERRSPLAFDDKRMGAGQPELFSQICDPSPEVLVLAHGRFQVRQDLIHANHTLSMPLLPAPCASWAHGMRRTVVTEVDDTKPLYPVLDPVRPASEMGLTDEQLAWLADIATPRCCHTTGEHDPSHFKERKFVCRDQLSEVAYRLRDALGLDADPVLWQQRGHYLQRRIDPSEAVSRAGCSRCEA